MKNSLLLGSVVSDVFTTSDGSALTIDCTVAYGNEAEKKANAMMGSISSTIADSQCAEKILTVTNGRTFSANGNQVETLSIFHVISTYSYKING